MPYGISDRLDINRFEQMMPLLVFLGTHTNMAASLVALLIMECLAFDWVTRGHT